MRGRTVVVGVSGGIAAYKACELVRWLRTRDVSVIVVMTRAATEFVTPLTFQTLSGNPVIESLWGDQAPRLDLPADGARKVKGRVAHVDIAEVADAIVIAPLIVCPAMDLEMWKHAATQDNVRALRARGAMLVGPESGPLASGLDGPGRLASIDAIGEAIERALLRRSSMKGTRVLVSAGRTEEPIDPVRVLTNRSSGRMGYAIAAAARDRGADVTLVTGPASIDAPHGITVVPVTTASEMERALGGAAEHADVIVMAAAVADYRPATVARDKIARRGGPLTLTLEPNADILAGLAERRRKGQVFVGFALETSGGVARARAKLAAKHVDVIVLNTPSAAIGSATNRVTLVEARTQKRLPVLLKREVAEHILDRAMEIRTARAPKAASAKARRKRS